MAEFLAEPPESLGKISLSTHLILGPEGIAVWQAMLVTAPCRLAARLLPIRPVYMTHLFPGDVGPCKGCVSYLSFAFLALRGFSRRRPLSALWDCTASCLPRCGTHLVTARPLHRLGSTTENCHEVPVTFPCYTIIVLRFRVEKIVLIWGLNDIQKTENKMRMFLVLLQGIHILWLLVLPNVFV